jgi:general stress protein 26
MDDVLHPNLIEDINKLGALIKDIRIAMMTTLDENGRMHSRPMMTNVGEFEGNLWFFSSISSHKVSNISWNRQVHLIYSSPEKREYISISGTAEILRDSKKMKELWNSSYVTWFPKGLSDPDLILMKIDIDQAEYWEPSKTQTPKVFEFSSSNIKVSGIYANQHKKIDLAG